MPKRRLGSLLSRLLVAGVAGSLGAVGASAQTASSPGLHASGAELSARLDAQPPAAMVVARVDNTDLTRVNLIRRSEPRNAIVHATGWEVHHVTAGRATIVTGGRVERSTDAEGNRRAVIVDGESRPVAPGDVVVVPPGTPHWYAQIEEPVTYLEIRYDPGAPGSDAPTLAPLVTDWRDADWGPPTNRDGFPAGLRNAPISTDPATGGPTYLARFPAGSEFELHWHTYTETVTVLDGTVDITLDGTRYTAGAGSYVIIPGGVHHAWHVPDEGDVVLRARRDGPADFFFVER